MARPRDDRADNVEDRVRVRVPPGAAKLQAEAGVELFGGRLEKMCPAVVPRRLRDRRDEAASRGRPRELGPGRLGAVVAMAIGPNLVLTGSVATVTCRRLARASGVDLDPVRFSRIGIALTPAMVLVALVGLRLTGAV